MSFWEKSDLRVKSGSTVYTGTICEYRLKLDLNECEFELVFRIWVAMQRRLLLFTEPYLLRLPAVEDSDWSKIGSVEFPLLTLPLRPLSKAWVKLEEEREGATVRRCSFTGRSGSSVRVVL
ncbi:hypothetical protein F511_15414 [Dorcoceras hygrometricum]|uniref:Uncharacterized protein n=1 Tax=Dorcoceras hygrometricum TaxID=472368 RepID=A0A2Z7A5B9_9LAMI|nr:hypothetical protein F511_15414 [Dorcoceras hygrometricum]